MFGPLLLLAASASPVAPASLPATDARPGPAPRISATARARVGITIISGVRFGTGGATAVAGADRRTSTLTDGGGVVRPAELLEFQ